MDLFNAFVLTLLYVAPLYIANSSPLLVHGRIPLDLNKKIFGEPILGKGKTVLGTITGITAGTGAGTIIYLFFPFVQGYLSNYILLSFMLSSGAILGDITKSFFKRRFHIKSGEKWELADQLDFVLGGIILSIFVRVPEFWLVALLLFATFFIHKTFNYIAFKLKLKSVPW
ncbi:MAG: CDP-2,3-bis-(O-geranylgeranyl)-sn-glycerol synthase [Candidatus ainarchaeum sp.]|jgi:CDP-2,3-bis-(O-geranylgeranyl)-sn-glycerol synthase|nr:CDP-2,3-bis-(O-geranylgeranyl)-sn-glycerol synthase [Candidatus ainarchaeum sp.]MDD3085653.1 CDP-2,3-bis-(O-geranylgeranyl)-sn-glycerol synthase [Candidatus ainarchaeum sp.]MDD4128286.1 CDP-2,3-bis-(O-geranylgeranyl)-sn-glycerol synthase [Candidatus ainarchaeum sp.]MDD4468067.1 CDP-2,3-bis-(O-geranylgeranyl)-sn-glycerol synthase [Candidatus ainarchaeum sp.]HPM85832.1 CDP-2,3-bis-(O-geranylgeranyl)-sn-glycerol synthase [archaeon]